MQSYRIYFLINCCGFFKINQEKYVGKILGKNRGIEV